MIASSSDLINRDRSMYHEAGSRCHFNLIQEIIGRKALPPVTNGLVFSTACVLRKGIPLSSAENAWSEVPFVLPSQSRNENKFQALAFLRVIFRVTKGLFFVFEETGLKFGWMFDYQ